MYKQVLLRNVTFRMVKNFKKRGISLRKWFCEIKNSKILTFKSPISPVCDYQIGQFAHKTNRNLINIPS